MSNRSVIVLLAALFLAACATPGKPVQPAHGLQSAQPRNVLFVGNSFTYYNNSLHNHYRKLVRAAAPDAAPGSSVRSMTISGGRLPEHAGGLPSMLDSAQWDVVVLQGHSRGPVEQATAAAFRDAARAYAGWIRERGARPVFFMTWAYTDEPAMTALLDTAYSAIAQELDAQVVPVGLAFAAVTAARPDLLLRTDDGRHPTLAGSYLAACTFYAALHGQSPVGNRYSAGLERATVAYLQQVAADTVKLFGAR